MHSRIQLIMKLSVTAIFVLWLHATSAEMSSEGDSLNSLYNNNPDNDNIRLLAYRKRGPSKRLRFGRSDDLLPYMAEKRWYGDVDQKPIRSKSLRLRFGRRSDPTMPLLNNEGGLDDLADEYNDIYGNYFERMARKPQRLRFGRSVPVEDSKA